MVETIRWPKASSSVLSQDAVTGGDFALDGDVEHRRGIELIGGDVDDPGDGLNPSNIDRRRLLISTAAFATYSIEPDLECAEAARLTTAAQPLSSAPGVQGLLSTGWRSEINPSSISFRERFFVCRLIGRSYSWGLRAQVRQQR